MNPAEPPPGTPEAIAAPTRTAGLAAASGCLLYIEDNPVNMLLVAELVAQRGGLHFCGAGTGQEGLQLAKERLPHLILLDMHLPDAHGLEVLTRLQAETETRHIPCIALSANALPADIEAALAHGCADYWTKPLDFGAFHHTLDTLFGPAAPVEVA